MNLIQEVGIKDLEHVVLKAKQDMYLGGRDFKAGEPILYFRNIQIALLTEDTRVIAAKGGYLNKTRVIWEDRQDTTFQFSNGTLNELSLEMLLGTNIIKSYEVHIPFQEHLVIGDKGKVYLSHTPVYTKPRFYKVFQAENVQHYITIEPLEEDGNNVVFPEKYVDWEIVADYYFLPKDGAQIYTMARERKSNLYTLEATFYLKDENDGLLHTGILEMPKVYIMSNINLRMGERADPTVGTFRIMAMPDMLDGVADTVCRVTYLDEDIYGI